MRDAKTSSLRGAGYLFRENGTQSVGTRVVLWEW